ncbi:2821_t:CDS:2 [Racocetra fulgida]|uniref:2821_t:CDS:1 n=1 Tax=Racocetra fulgida TaxID=60492 RepID=A0A9N9BEI4_9GLOM|nr:2821_t:CDS:2 [Racocetra fulgida]
MNVLEYINYTDEEDIEKVLDDQEISEVTENEGSDDDKDNSTEMRIITHQKALNALDLLDQYFLQQDLNEVARLEHDVALLNLCKQQGSFRMIFINKLSSILFGIQTVS